MEGDSDGHETSLLNLQGASPEWVRLPYPPPSFAVAKATSDFGGQSPLSNKSFSEGGFRFTEFSPNLLHFKYGDSRSYFPKILC